MSTSAAAVVAFRKAQALAEQSRVVSLEASALDINEPDTGLSDHLSDVREALVKSYKVQGATVNDDAHGERFRERHPEIDEDEFWELVNHREEAGYLYGLALGLILGRGGVR